MNVLARILAAEDDHLPPTFERVRDLPGGRRIEPTHRRLYGFWRRVAEAIRDGAHDEVAIARATHAGLVDVNRALRAMEALGHVHRECAHFHIAKRTRRQLAEERGR